MKVLNQKLSMDELNRIAGQMFGDMVKAVVDIDKELLAIDAELHSDLEALLLQEGSKQEHLWGINLYPQVPAEDFIEFESMINVRPSRGNRSRGVESEAVRQKITELVTTWITQ